MVNGESPLAIGRDSNSFGCLEVDDGGFPEGVKGEGSEKELIVSEERIKD